MSQPYVGEIRLFPYNFAPEGWFECNGALYAISQYDTLFNLIGTTYGGDGVNTFAVPDLRGRVPIHQGQGQGLSSYLLGQMAGSETVTLLPNQMPAHSHAFNAVSTAASSSTPSSTMQPGSVSGDVLYTTDITGLASVDMAATATGTAGNTQPHDNTMPTLVARFCIAWAGVYPSQG